MQRTITTVGLLALLLLAASVPASAAPRNANNEDFVIPVSCVDADGEDAGWTAVRPTPSQEGKPAWDIDTGKLQVGKSFTFTVTVTVSVIGTEDDAGMTVFEDGSDHGSSTGNKELITCTAVFFDEVFHTELDITPEFAAALNADFGTDIFEAGQDVEFSETGVLTVLAIVPGRR